ncbi:MAG: DUF2178 domain-containing protein [archaeon]
MKGSSVFNAGLFLAFIGLGTQIAFGEIGVLAGSALSTAGIVLTVKGYLMQKHPEKLKKDERSKKISAWAASHSWMITIFALMIMFWINKLNILTLGTDLVIGLTYIVMVASLMIYKYHFNKKGDIE